MGKKKREIKEKHIIKHIVDNWNKLLGEEKLHFFKTEYCALDDWRCDILAYVYLDLEEMGYENAPRNYRAPIYTEVKFNSDSRDLIYEISKGLRLVNQAAYPRYIAVISDDFSDPTILDFLVENKIHMWQIKIKDDDLSTLRLEYYEPDKQKYDIQEIEGD